MVPRISAPAGDLARVIRILSGKGGATGAIFDPFGFSVTTKDGKTVVSAEHRNKRSTVEIRADWFGATADEGTSFGVATDKPERWISYLGEGQFATDARLDFVYDADAGRVIITDRNRRVSMATSPHKSLPRSESPNGEGNWSPAPDGLWVSSSPERRPKPEVADDWAAWTANGYRVVKIPMTSIRGLTEAGSALLAHTFKKTITHFEVSAGVARVFLVSPDNPDSDTIDYQSLPGAEVLGNGTDSFDLLFEMVYGIWAALGNVRADCITLVHLPGERRVCFLVAEDDSAGHPLLRVATLVLTYRSARGGGSTPSAPARGN